MVVRSPARQDIGKARSNKSLGSRHRAAAARRGFMGEGLRCRLAHRGAAGRRGRRHRGSPALPSTVTPQSSYAAILRNRTPRGVRTRVLNHKQRALHPRLHCADATGLLPTYSPDAYQSHPALTSSGSSDGKRAAREPLSRLPRLSPPPALPPSLAAAVPSPSEPGVAASLFPPFSFLSLGGRAKTVARNGTRQSTSSLARLSTPSRSRCGAMAGQGE